MAIGALFRTLKFSIVMTSRKFCSSVLIIRKMEVVSGSLMPQIFSLTEQSSQLVRFILDISNELVNISFIDSLNAADL